MTCNNKYHASLDNKDDDDYDDLLVFGTDKIWNVA